MLRERDRIHLDAMGGSGKRAWRQARTLCIRHASRALRWCTRSNLDESGNSFPSWDGWPGDKGGQDIPTIFSLSQASQQLVNFTPQDASIRALYTGRDAHDDIFIRQPGAEQAEGFSHNAPDQIAVHGGAHVFFCDYHTDPRSSGRTWSVQQIEIFGAKYLTKSKNG